MERTLAKRFQDLLVWQKAHQLVLSVYNYSDYFPQKEVYGLTQQFRRAAISIATNIAGGCQLKSAGERIRLMKEAQGALEECRYYLVLAKDLGYGEHPELLPQLEEVSHLLEKYTAAIPAPEL